MDSSAVIIDSNAFIYSIRQRIDLKKSLQDMGFRDMLVPDCVIRELEGLSASVREAKAALEIAARFKPVMVEGTCDSAIVRHAMNNRCSILTNDREMISEAKSGKIHVFTIKRSGIIDTA
jgi:rRNA-processing protein FCF1